MRRLTLIGMCLAMLTAFAVSSVASASAAEPALYECHKIAKNLKTKKYEGKWLKGCKVEATEKQKEEGLLNQYEIVEWNLANKKGIAKVFKGKAVGGPNLELTLNVGVLCKAATDSGKFTSPKTAGDIVVTFTGCEFNGKKCESASTVGTIVTNPLKGEVGYLAGKGTKTPIVGSDISPESGEVLARFKCASPAGVDVLAVTGSTIGEVSEASKGKAVPFNTFAKEAIFNFEEEGVGVPKWTHLEGGANDVLTAHICTGFECPNPETEGATAQGAELAKFINVGEELMLKA